MLYSGLPNSPKKKTSNQKPVAAVAEKVPAAEKVVEVHEVLKSGSKSEKDGDADYTPESSSEESDKPKKVVWENYSKKDLYFKWVKARNDATDLRKDKNDLDEIRKQQAKEIKEYLKQLKGVQSLHTKNDTLRRKLQDETGKAQREKLEAHSLLESNEIALEKIKTNYEVMTTKADIETAATLGKLDLQFSECKLKLDAKEKECALLTDENKRLKKRIDKLEDLTVVKTKSDMQVLAMNEKNLVK